MRLSLRGPICNVKLICRNIAKKRTVQALPRFPRGVESHFGLHGRAFGQLLQFAISTGTFHGQQSPFAFFDDPDERIDGGTLGLFERGELPPARGTVRSGGTGRTSRRTGFGPAFGWGGLISANCFFLRKLKSTCLTAAPARLRYGPRTWTGVAMRGRITIALQL